MSKELVFKEVYTSHQASVLRLCLGYFGGDKQLADEVCQEVFIKVWNYLDGFEGKSQIGTWIYRISVNTCLNTLRSSKKKHKHLELHEHIVADQEDEPSVEDTRLQSLYACIEELNPKDKSIILLVLEQEPYADIAEILGISENYLRVKIHRIKDKLSKCVSL